jgi:hypothetical protein
MLLDLASGRVNSGVMPLGYTKRDMIVVAELEEIDCAD